MNRRGFFGTIVAAIAGLFGKQLAEKQVDAMRRDWELIDRAADGEIVVLGPPVEQPVWYMSKVDDPDSWGLPYSGPIDLDEFTHIYFVDGETFRMGDDLFIGNS